MRAGSETLLPSRSKQLSANVILYCFQNCLPCLTSPGSASHAFNILYQIQFFYTYLLQNCRVTFKYTNAMKSSELCIIGRDGNIGVHPYACHNVALNGAESTSTTCRNLNPKKASLAQKFCQLKYYVTEKKRCHMPLAKVIYFPSMCSIKWRWFDRDSKSIIFGKTILMLEWHTYVVNYTLR